MDQKFCQSCAMPLTKPEEFGTEAGGLPSEDYCVHCRKDGKFEMPDCTMEQMIDFCVPYCAEMGVYPSAEAAKAAMLEFFPQLKRWAKQAILHSYKLVESASTPEFLLAAQKIHDEMLSKKPGFVSWQVFQDGSGWADLVVWENTECALNAEKDETPNPAAMAFGACIDYSSLKRQAYSVAKSF